jgi:hypothetical protein
MIIRSFAHLKMVDLLAVQASDYAAQLAAAFGALAQAAEQSASATLLLEVRTGLYALPPILYCTYQHTSHSSTHCSSLAVLTCTKLC